ncbi:DUF4157 domain-containing protein [Paenibacillus sp. MWE-103]|uniref:DUF4157 domain-containing protein n=1 Tax=Paenibacillus artemisiicola TaxID=1172618 RepID=A0ABS3W5L5_9BACL|nr:DUF4157 domain-containing protein [Paenibacillus artemisiicola]MBO7743583.1 DUF4157 domain-containing protein [Paenibacillus artemisiicola]
MRGAMEAEKKSRSTPSRETVRPSKPSPWIQTKLTVSQPGDPYEREADRVAEQVMRMPATNTSSDYTSVNRVPLVQRKCAACESEEDVVLSRFPNGHVQAQPQLSGRYDGSSATNLSSSMENRIGSLEGGGSPLSRQSRSFFENRMGWDFGNVRVHTDAEAARTSQLLQARAFTVGGNIAFAPGEYQPATPEGDRLLAHELTHVIQQTKGSNRQVQRDFFDDVSESLSVIEEGATSAWDAVSSAAGETWDAATGAASEAMEAVSEAGEGSATDVVLGLALSAAQAIISQFGGKLTVEDGVISLNLPNVTLLRRFAKGTAWNDATDDVLLGQYTMELEELGFLFLSVLGRGELDVSGEVGVGPVQLKELLLQYDTKTKSFSGWGTLSGQVDVAAYLTMTGILSGVADWNCVKEIVRVEGGLSVTGSPALSAELNRRVKLDYENGEFFLQDHISFDPCASFALSLDGMLSLFILDYPVASGSWHLADHAWEKCWNIPITLANNNPAAQGGSTGGGGSSDSWGDEESGAANSLIGVAPASLNGVFSASGVLQNLFGSAKTELTMPGPLNADATSKAKAVCKPKPKPGGTHKAPTGAIDDPIKMIWYKPLRGYRNPIYLKFDPSDRSDPHDRKEPYYRNLRKRLPRSSKFIGAKIWPKVGTKLQRDPTPRDTSVTKKYREDLEEFGFDMWEKSCQPDHVVDLAFGGEDTYANLWPLDGTMNMAAGPLHSFKQKVKYNFPDDAPEHEPREEFIVPPRNPAFFNGRWFVISSVQSPF